MKAPFPWFGGKRKIAPEVWAALGDVDNYVEPFAGSLAVLLERPAWHNGVTETVNDADQYLANFWRALAHDPDAVARYADWPSNECVPAGTLIATPCGDIPIEEISPGMIVWGEKDGQVVPTTVVATKRSEAQEFVNVGGLRLTGNHPVWTTERGYLESEQLTNGLHIAIIDCPVNELDLPMLYLGHESTCVGNLYSKRSENGYGAICRRHLSGASPFQRAFIASDARWQNLSRLLDSITDQPGRTACISSDRAWAGRGLAGQRKILDCSLPYRGETDELDGWWRRDTWIIPFGEVSSSGFIVPQGNSLPAGSCTGDVGQKSYTRGYRKDSRSGDGAQAHRGRREIAPRREASSLPRLTRPRALRRERPQRSRACRLPHPSAC